MRHSLDLLREKFDCIRCVRGVGLLNGIEFQSPIQSARRLSRAAMNYGLIIRSLRDAPHVLAVVPPLIIDEQGVEHICARLDKAISDALNEPSFE